MLTYCEGNSCARSRICLAPLRSGCSELLAVLFRDGNAVVVGCRAARVFLHGFAGVYGVVDGHQNFNQ